MGKAWFGKVGRCCEWNGEDGFVKVWLNPRCEG
jgi:hypothetical protein